MRAAQQGARERMEDPNSPGPEPKLEALCADATCGKYVFSSARTGGRITDIKRGWKSALDEAGIDDLCFHDLRHEWSSRAADCGVPEHVRRDGFPTWTPIAL